MPRQPWASLVSEVMAQQTQISRVLECFPRFLARFPTPAALADADEQEVLALWRGLGYYRRARLLHAAAREIVLGHAGAVPDDVQGLIGLPGIGRYSAGAVASIALGQREPIVDGNIARVLLRLHGRPGRAGDAESDRWCWQRATGLVGVCADPPAFNEGLMEIGALVCTPAAPRCGACPLASVCAARRDGMQDQIPTPRPRGRTPIVDATALLALDPGGRVLVERRPTSAMWGGLWQVPTLERRGAPVRGQVGRWACGPVGRSVLRFEFQTTHRLFKFDVRRVACDQARVARLDTRPGHPPGASRWLPPGEAGLLPMSSPQRRILAMVGDSRL